MEWKVCTAVVAKCQGHARIGLILNFLGDQPPVMLAAVTSLTLVPPAVGKLSHPRRFSVLQVQMERRIGVASPVGLEPHRISVRQADGSWVVKATDALQRPVNMVERPVLLHEDDDVLGIEIGCPRSRIDCERLLDRRGQCSGHAAAGRQEGRLFEKLAA